MGYIGDDFIQEHHKLGGLL